jgi:predicted permease
MSLFQDVRFAIRMLLQRPGFLLLAGVSLAIGIGASTAVFSILHTLLLQQLAVPNSKELVGLYPVSRNTHNYDSFSYLNYVDFRNRSRSLGDVMAYGINPFNLSTGNGAERVWGDLATANYFSVLGVPAMLGRTFVPEEDHTSGAHPVVVLSFRLWAGRFASDPHAVGTQVLLNGHSYTIIGVAPKSFHGTELGLEPDLWIPITMQRQAMPGWDALPQRGSGWLRAVGRLKPGITLDRARKDSERIAEQLEKEFPRENEGMTIALVPDFILLPQFRGKIRDLVLILAGLVGTLLSVSCVNLAGLLLARTSGRANEFAMRTALGASRLRVVRQVLTESVLLSLFGGVGGVILAAWLLDVITKFQSASPLPSIIRFGMDSSVLLFAFAISMATGLVFGFLPAVQATREEPAMSIKRASAGRGARISKVRSLLVAVQIAMAFVLLAAAGLFLKSFQQATKIDPGFAADRTVQLSFDLGAQGYTEQRAKSFARSLLANVDRQPGVASTALATLEPLGLSDRDMSVFFENPS